MFDPEVLYDKKIAVQLTLQATGQHFNYWLLLGLVNERNKLGFAD